MPRGELKGVQKAKEENRGPGGSIKIEKAVESAQRGRCYLVGREIPFPAYVPPPGEWRAWRPSEEEVYRRDPGRLLRSLVLPPILADAVELLLDDEPRRQAMGEAARRVAEERYSWSSVARRLIDLYA